MARDYDKEIAAAEAKLQRIREAKAASERRQFEPVGRAMFEQFGVELSHCGNVTETKQFIGELRRIYDLYQRKQEQRAQSQPHGQFQGQGRQPYSEGVRGPENM